MASSRARFSRRWVDTARVDTPAGRLKERARISVRRCGDAAMRRIELRFVRSDRKRISNVAAAPRGQPRRTLTK